jgi:hypothetical protein
MKILFPDSDNVISSSAMLKSHTPKEQPKAKGSIVK